ncbi:MAG TPA: FAD-dependent oxidoreductase [Vicinamibacterales bacterium]|nr:FAD-dependent oxidoreductase [Vicinamibacterales bacterium]
MTQLTARTFDVLVVGGGVYGLTIAYDAAQRGLSVALIERADFGSGASFNHLRTIHGGLRYLQTLDIGRARESMRERRAIATIAPHAVRPLRFALPLHRSLTRGVTAMRGGFLLDRLIAFDRNRGVAASHRLPPGRVVTGADLQRIEGLAQPGVRAAAVWYDYVTVEADRLTFSFALAAAEHGAVLANHVEAVALIAEGPRVTGVRARDLLGDGELEVAARVTVNATGGAVDRLLEPIGAATNIPMMMAMNLVTRRTAGDTALGGRSSFGRNFFLVPWRGRSLFGTWESGSRARAKDAEIAEADILSFVRELNEAFPSLALGLDDVTLVHRGQVPAAVGPGGLRLEGHEHVRDHSSDRSRNLEGLVSVVGAKYTTARGVAERVTSRLLTKLHKPAVACRTATTPLPGAPADAGAAAGPPAAWRDNLPDDASRHLAGSYGSRCAEILAVCAEKPDLATRLSDEGPVTGAEIAWAARHEMALTLADAVVRRTPLGALGYPGDRAVDRAASIMASELRWTSDRRAVEIQNLRNFFARSRFG